MQSSLSVSIYIFAGALQLLSWGLISSHADATSSVGVLTSILTITNMGAAISEVVNDALVAEAGKNKEGAQEGGWRLRVKLLHLHCFYISCA